MFEFPRPPNSRSRLSDLLIQTESLHPCMRRVEQLDSYSVAANQVVYIVF